MKIIKIICLFVISFSSICFSISAIAKNTNTQVTKLKITTLSTMLASKGIGEWGYSALIEADGHKVLFDTGGRPDLVLKNALELKIDLSVVEDVFLSHNHGDHTGGLLTLRKELKKKNPKALSRIHVGKGIFSERVNYTNKMIAIRKQLEAEGVSFIIHQQHNEVFPGIWTTGQVKRIHNEKNWSGNGKINSPHGHIEDNIPEDQSIAINTNKGIILVSGCGHAGIINTMEHIHNNIENKRIYAAIGGFHLVSASDEHLQWTADKLKKFAVSNIVGAHCTGIDSLYTLRNLLGLSRKTAVVGSVGDSFELKSGIHPGYIAR